MTSVDQKPATAPHTAIAVPNDLASVPDVVARLRATFVSGRTRSLEWRRAQLLGIQRLVQEREGEIAAALETDLGRSAADAWLGDVVAVVAEAKYASKHLPAWMKDTKTPLPAAHLPGRGFIRYEPLGVALVIGTWNYPVYLTLGPLVGALAAGNTAVIKPSEQAPAASQLLARLVPQYLDPDAVAVLQGEAEVTTAIFEQKVDHALFTGSERIGTLVAQTAAKHLTPVTLELGGKCPLIVDADADLEITARRILWAKLVNAGQTCITPDYVIAHASVADKLVSLLKKTMRDFRAGETKTQRVVNRRQFDRLAGLLESHGGEVVIGGATDASDSSIEPTVILNPHPDSAVMSEEIFGPILPIVTVDSIDAAIGLIAARPKPLAVYYFGSNDTSRDRVIAETSSGGVVVNHIGLHCMAPQLPFGGVGSSGMGAYHGRFGFETFSHRKAVVLKRAKPDVPLIYPPHTPLKMSLLRRLF